MKLHLPHLLRRAVVRALFAAAAVVTTLASATHADMITPDGRTATQVIQSGNVYDVYTNTVRGRTGFNSFSTFDVYADTTANLHLADGTGRLINVVRDSASHIDGVLNSYKDGRIGGDVYFLNPNGIFVGKTGVINVGSISMSTPTAAFVEQLIARDGSISPTATQAVLAGDMPINEKGTISIKGKVNAERTVEMRAGKVEVQGGEINTGVKFGEMVNTGKRKVDTKGMSIQGGRLSFGKKPAKARRAVARAKVRKQEKKADIAIFADDVQVDGGALNADWVYIDPDKLEFSNQAISGDYTLEARVIVLNNISVKQGETLTSFTLNAANELADGTFAGNVSITLSNSNLTADSVDINATATTNAADAIISITGSTLIAAQGDGSMGIYATSKSGNTSVNIQNSTLTADSMEIGAMSLAGNAVLTLGSAAAVKADTVALTAGAVTGNADVNVQGKVTGGNDVTITATTGNVVFTEAEDIKDQVYTAEGGGNATVTVSGTVEAQGALTVSALAIGTHGDATLNLNGKLSSLHTETKSVGELVLARTEAETVKETDSPEAANSKNAAFMKRYNEYLKGMPTDTAATAAMNIAATSAAGNASITQAAASELQSSLSTTISADAAKAASVLLAGKVASGDIRAAATGETATLRVAEGASLAAAPHRSFVREGTVVSVSKENGAVSLEARSNKDDQPEPAPEPQKGDGILLEVAGTVTARREAGDKQGAGEGGAISLASDGKLTVTDKAGLDASSANGKGGTIDFDAPEYGLQSPLGYKVDGTTGQGTINLVNHEGLTGENINNADDISRDFIKKVLNLSAANGDNPKQWTSGFTLVTLSGNIVLTKNVEASIQTAAIADGTHIDGQGKYSLTLTNSAWHNAHLGCSVTIGKNVSITGVTDFTFKFRNHAVADSLVSTYFGGPTSLTVGDNFKVEATGNVAITTEGVYNTYIQFGKGVNIQAGGDVTISAKNKNGMGTSLLTSASTDLIGKVVKLIPGADDSPVGKALSQLGILKFDSDKFFKKLFNRVMGMGWDKDQLSQLNLPQIGVRVSKASVTFGENDVANKGLIKGNTVTISSSSTANVSGRKNATNDIAGISIGYIYNDSTVDLGKNLVVTATGASSANTSVSITSTTKSKLSLENCYDSGADTCAVGVLVAVGTDFNTLNIDESVQISAPNDIKIKTASDIEAESFMSLGSGWEKLVHPNDGQKYEEDEGASASNIVMFGANVMVHKSTTTINGTLESTDGSISMTSEDSISSSLTMNGTLEYTLSKAGLEKKPGPDQSFLQFLGTTIRECLTLDLALGKLKIGEDFKKLIDKDGVLDMFQKNGDYDFLSLYQDAGGEEERCIDMSIATDIVVTENKLTFNGTATAGGDITVEASTEIEAACGAETSIVGVPTEKAIAGSISVPVVVGDTVAKIGSMAKLSAGGNISVSSSTELPMSFDYMGWNGWAKFVKASGQGKAADFISALRGSLKFIYDYKDNGDFGVLDSLTSSHASTLMKGTGGDMTIGGDLVVDVRNLNTKTVINDGASLTAGKKISAESSAKGTQVTFAGRLPIFLTLSRPVYMSTASAASGFGASVIVAEKTFNTVTYIGAATLKARQLEVDATGDAFMMEMSLAGTFGSSNHGVQGGVNVISENKMAVSEISGDANITLSGTGEKEGSSITATDKSVLLNITGLEADGGKTAVGVGVAVTVNNALTAAMLGNNMPISSSYESNWKSVWGNPAMPFDRAGAITLNFKGDKELDVKAENKSTLVNIGISAAVQKGGSGVASVAANVGVDYSHTETTARQYGVTGTGNNGQNDVSTEAVDTSTLVSVAGDVSVNTGDKNVVTGAGAFSANKAVMDTTAYVTGCNYSSVGEFTLDTSDKATAVAVDVAACGGGATAGIAAGLAWNTLTGNTGSYLTGGSIAAKGVVVTSLTDLTSFTCTLGAAVGISTNARGEGGDAFENDIGSILGQSELNNNSDDLENDLANSFMGRDSGNASLLGDSLALGEGSPVLQAGDGVAFDVGASIARNAVDMSSKAIVEGCTVSTPGAFTVTASDTSVITAIGVGAAFTNESGISVGAGGVFSFAPVSSTTEAAIRQATGAPGKLDIHAGSLTLHAMDNHRERVWSFGGGYGDTAGIALVLSWGSFAGATTLALIENVNATIATKADIQASSNLDATYISVGASASKGTASGTGMLNYLNFNNQVMTDIKGSTLTVTAANGEFTALSKGTRNFTDGVGDLAIRVGGKKPGAALGTALSFVYVGGNGKDDTNLTQTRVENSFINNSGKTNLLATGSTTGILAGANAAIAGGEWGLAGSGSFSWVSDSSFTQVDIQDTYFNQRKAQSDANADIKAEATSTSNLTFGFGTLGVQIGEGAGIGATVGVLKDNATTAATMTGGGVASAHDFTLHASGKADIAALIIGGAGSARLGISGGALATTIAHTVTTSLEESVMNMNGALTVKADNTSNVGRDHGARFTVANAAVGLAGGGVGVDVSYIDVADRVEAKAHNVSVHSGSMSVLADETGNADAITVNVAGGQFVAAELNLVRPVLRGAAVASVTSDLPAIADNTPVGITTTGDLNVKATNTQWMRSHLWSLALTVNPQAVSLSASLCVNEMNMVGSSNAMVDGAMPLSVGGNLNVTAETTRQATYTTVPVVAAVALGGITINIDVNSLRVSSDTSALTDDEAANKGKAAKEVDAEIDAVCKLIESTGVKLDDDTKLAVSDDVRGSMNRAAAAVSELSTPETSAKVNLHGKKAEVGGSANIIASDSITTTPTTVPVSGGMLAIAPHINKTNVASTVEASVEDTILETTRDITIDAKQTHTDHFRNVGVAVAGLSGMFATYDWTDNATTKISLAAGTQLNAKQGKVNIGTHSSISETFHHVNVGVGVGKIAFILPTFRQTENSTLSIANGVAIEAQGAVTIGNESVCNLNATTYDVTLAAVSAGTGDTDIKLNTTQELTAGDAVGITGGSVDILQKATRTIGITEDHISGTVLALSFPFLNTIDTVNATLSIGNGASITAKEGALTIASDITTKATISYLGVNAIGGSITLADNKFKETIKNKVKLGNGVTLLAEKGEMTLRAKNNHTGDLKGTNIAANIASLADHLGTYNTGDITSEVVIGTDFAAKGQALTLEACNTDVYLYHGKKVSVSLALNPFSRNAYEASGSSTATITLMGTKKDSKIDVNQFKALATTDVAVKVSQLLGGGSITVDVNLGKVTNNITQTATVTLGTGDNELNILTDSIQVNAHNKHLFTRLDESTKSMVYGGDIGLVSGTSKGTVDAKQNVNATVTLGSGSKIQRRADVEHYLHRADYGALIAATNNVDSRTEISLFSGGLLNANCILTTYDATTANATLNLNGTIDTWGNAELTAYSHSTHNMINSVTSGAIVPTFNSDVKNTIDTNDAVKINGSVESIGNITIQSGSTGGQYKLVDGTTVLSGDDDTNTTNYFWGKDKAVIHNRRAEALTINADLRAGGELAIYNDSSANTVKQPFHKSGQSNDYRNAAADTAADVTSTIGIAGSAKLYAGLGSAIKMVFLGNGAGTSLQFSSAQRIFDGSTRQQDGTWLAPSSVLGKLADTSGDRLRIGALTLPGMAFRIETQAGQGVFSGKLYSPAKHGLDVVVSSAYSGDVETRGITLQGYETGLFFNRKAVDNAVATCAAPDLYRSEGVSIRSQAQGNLYITGKYDFPYSTFYVECDNDIVITGNVLCGATTMNAGGDFIIDAGDNNYGFHGPLAMYTSLFDSWEGEAQQKVVSHAAKVAKDSGNNEHDTDEGCYRAENYEKTFSANEIKQAASAEMSKGEGVINSSGRVSIKAKVVDLNGKIYSGYHEADYVINPGFMVLTADGKKITVDQARALYNKDHANSIFKLDGYSGISLVYDAANDWISLNSYLTRTNGIDITGIIVNSDPTGTAGLYVADGSRDLNINNKTAYTLNIGTIDLTLGENSGIRLENTATGIITTYKLNDKGEWVQNIGGTITNLGAATSATYSGTANYQVVLQKKTSTPISESGRLTFGGSLNGAKVGNIYNNGKVGSKETIIDRMTVNTQGVSVISGLTYAYSPATVANGMAKSSHSLTNKVLDRLYNPGTFYRYKYTLKYADECTNTLYISAANSVGIHFGGGGSASSGLSITSGNVNFSGVVKSSSCTVKAADSITAGAFARINGNAIGMTANTGSIGSAENPLVFNAHTATFAAGQNLYLVTQQNTDKLDLAAGKSLALRSEGAIGNLSFRAGNEAVIAAQGQINVSTASTAATTTLSSANSGITVVQSDFSPGVLTAEAEGNISISTTRALVLDYVESRQGSVTLSADQGITSVRSTDLTRFSAVDGSNSTSLKQQAENYRDDVSDEYYAKLLYYEKLYYEQDEKGKYTHRDANGTFILPEENETLAELSASIKKIYDGGLGDNLSWFMMSLSGTPAVDGTKFANEKEALAYLAQHPDRLETDFARTYYDQMVAELTAEICKLHGNLTKVDYGKFNEGIYRLYWLKDSSGKYVNQDANGNFISPKQVDGFGTVVGPVYNDDECKAITAQFKKQAPGSTYDTKGSSLLGNLSHAASGYLNAKLQLGKLNNGLASVIGGKPIGEMETTVRAKDCITLTTRDDQNIGGGAFRFTVSPIGFKEDGTPIYSDWATAFRDEIRKGRRAGVQLVSENGTTGELLYAMSYFEARENSINELETSLLGQAVPGDIHDVGGTYRVYTRNYIAVDAPEVKASGKYVLLVSNRDIDLGDNNIHASNLYLSTTGSISGSMRSDNGAVNLYAEGGFGSDGRYCGISGSSIYTLGSDADVFLKVNGEVKLASLKGEHVTIDARGAGLVSALDAKEPNIIGRRIDFYGDLDSGLNFRTFGLTQDNGGLHWHGGGSSNTLRFGALNTAYTFWFVQEDDATAIRNLDIGYSGHLVLPELPKAETAAFRQVGSGDGRHILEFTGEQAFGRSLTFSGEGAYTVLAPQMLVLDSGGVINVGGDAILQLAGIDNAADQAVSIHSAGNLELASYNPHSPCNICDDLIIDGTGDVALRDIVVNGTADIHATGRILAATVGFQKAASVTGNFLFLVTTTGADKLLLNGRNGISGLIVICPHITANSSLAGVFLQAITDDLSGTSKRAFTAAVETMPGNSITVHDVQATGSTSRIKIRAITDELLLDGLISAAALEIYGSGSITRGAEVHLISDYPFLNVWKDHYADVWHVVMDSLEADLRESLVWLLEASDAYADMSTDGAQEMRNDANGDADHPALEQPRYLDRNGNTISREQYANLITGK